MSRNKYDNVPNQIAQLSEVNRAREMVGMTPLSLDQWLKERRFRTAGAKKASEQPRRYQNKD